MACIDPLIAFYDHRVSVLNPLKILRKDRVYCGGLSAREYRDQLCFGVRTLEAMDLPCGQCIECRLKQSREWANRLVMESKTSKSALFLTLTYDDDHLPHSDLGFPTLCKEDLRKFNKDLTKWLSRKFDLPSPRHFECGEYGSLTGRPHYHSIHFNLDPNILDLKPYKTNFRGDPFFTSVILTKIWGKGFVVVGNFSWDTAAYVARYVTKKLTGEKEKERFQRFHQLQEFVCMSNRPGIGFQYFLDNSTGIYFSNDGDCYIPVRGRVRAPRYFDKLFGVCHPEKLLDIKFLRQKKAIDAHIYTLKRIGWTEDQWRQNQLILSFDKLKKLPRREI